MDIDILDDRIRLSNPWWADPTALERDPHLEALNVSPFSWDPPVLSEISFRQSGIHTLRGPRQVGKTTTLKRLVRQLIERRKNRVLYFAFDLEQDPAQIVDVIRRARRLHPDSEGRWYLFLDEVTQIDGWQRGIKVAWDQGLIRDDVLVLSGSSAADLVEGAELMPGRRGEGDDHLQLPLSFHDFACVVRGIDVDVTPGFPHELLEPEGRRSIKRAALHLEELNTVLLEYLQCGGLPAPVRDFLAEGQVRERTLRSIWEAVAGDVSKRGLDRIAAMKLLDRIGTSLSGNFSWSAAARAMDMAVNSAKAYTRFLAMSFVVLPVYFWDLSGKGFNTSKERKVYFLDPSFSRLPQAARVNTRTPKIEGLLEGVVGVSLFRSVPLSLLETFPLPHSVGYWKATSGREIDFLADPQRHCIPVEVKWSNRANAVSNARRAIMSTFPGGIILTRALLDLEHRAAAMPISAFLYCLRDASRRLI